MQVIDIIKEQNSKDVLPNTLRKHLNIFLDKYHKNSYGQEKIYD